MNFFIEIIVTITPILLLMNLCVFIGREFKTFENFIIKVLESIEKRMKKI